MSSVFPATYSTLCPSALASLLSQRYGLEKVRCKLIVRGVGDTYSVGSAAGSASDRFILRIYRSSHRSLPQITAETTLLTALKQAKVSVSYPLPDLSGEMIQAIDAAEGRRYAVLFTYAPGRTVTRLNDNQLRDLGHQMARFHNVSSAIDLGGHRWNYDLQTLLFQPLEMVRSAFEDIPEEYAWWQQAAKSAAEKLAQLNTSTFSMGYCHFDFLPKNFHFEGDSVTFFDFDFLGYGWLVNDIMTFWEQLCLDVHNGRMTQEAADEAYAVFLDAYREYRDLQEEELSAIPYLALGFWLFYMGFHMTHDEFYQFVQPAVLKTRTGAIRQFMSKYWNK